ncbi:hypothetical protein [Streptomyces sp. NRRL WC-3742]|uniref:hypothetical protein n=1 Tax=Streptomyces sp. NRRL WC-3742 TaxID=1463934 RepID=UPI0004C8395D|nr:hypothetical protein [Streptomyces sp. NRRL WC-3742]
MSTDHIPAPAPEFAQTRVVDVFPLHGFMCAQTSNAAGAVRWWHLFTSAGVSLGATSRPELLGSLIQHTR